MSISFTTIEWLNRALVYVLNQCTQGAALFISESFTSGFTLMDKLAFILHKGINLAQTVSEWVVYLMRKILRLLGYGDIVEAADLTHNFIRSIFMQLQFRLNLYAREALNQVMVQGRAI